MQISLFIACYNDLLFPATGIAVVKVLERLGHTVVFRGDQTCCGQMHYNTGYQREALPLVKKFVETCRGDETVVSPSSSCVAHIRDHYAKLAALSNDDTLRREVEKLVPRVWEFSELLVKKFGVESVGAYYPHKVTYHPSCHSMRMLKLGDGPLRLLRAVRGIDLVELPNAGECCGFGGTFSVKNAATSSAMLADKVRCVVDSGAEICTGADNSCLMNINGSLHRQQIGVRTVHLAQILASTEEGEAQ